MHSNKKMRAVHQQMIGSPASTPHPIVLYKDERAAAGEELKRESRAQLVLPEAGKHSVGS